MRTTHHSSRSNNNTSRGSRSRSSISPNKTRKDGRSPKAKWKKKQSIQNPTTPLVNKIAPQSSKERIRQHKQELKKKKVIVKNILSQSKSGIVTTKLFKNSQLYFNSQLQSPNQSRSQSRRIISNRGQSQSKSNHGQSRSASPNKRNIRSIGIQQPAIANLNLSNKSRRIMGNKSRRHGYNRNGINGNSINGNGNVKLFHCNYFLCPGSNELLMICDTCNKEYHCSCSLLSQDTLTSIRNGFSQFRCIPCIKQFSSNASNTGKSTSNLSKSNGNGQSNTSDTSITTTAILADNGTSNNSLSDINEDEDDNTVVIGMLTPGGDMGRPIQQQHPNITQHQQFCTNSNVSNNINKKLQEKNGNPVLLSQQQPCQQSINNCSQDSNLSRTRSLTPNSQSPNLFVNSHQQHQIHQHQQQLLINQQQPSQLPLSQQQSTPQPYEAALPPDESLVKEAGEYVCEVCHKQIHRDVPPWHDG